MENLCCCRAEEHAAEVKAMLQARDFDVLGIEDNGVVCGYIKQSDLPSGGNKECGEYKIEFRISDLVAESTPLLIIFGIFRNINVYRVFVLVGNRIQGIITRGDLRKAPVRMWLFGLVSLLEMQFLRLIRHYYQHNSWKNSLPEERIKAAEELLLQRQGKKENIDLADCLQFCDKRDLILARNDIRSLLVIKSKSSGKSLLKKVEDLRNNLAHAQDIFAGMSWEQLIDLTEEVERLLQRCESIQTGDQTESVIQ